MKKFWQWMKEKDYPDLKAEDLIVDNMITGEYKKIKSKIPKQMLIGYMIEYLYEEHGLHMYNIFIPGASPDKYSDYIFKKIKTRIEKENIE